MFGVREFTVLGDFVGSNGCRVGRSKVETIRTWPIPANVGELRSWLELSTYLHGWAAILAMHWPRSLCGGSHRWIHKHSCLRIQPRAHFNHECRIWTPSSTLSSCCLIVFVDYNRKLNFWLQTNICLYAFLLFLQNTMQPSRLSLSSSYHHIFVDEIDMSISSWCFAVHESMPRSPRQPRT